LYTRAVPAFVLIVTLGVSAVVMCAYFIFLGIIGAAAVEFADTLIIGAVVNFLLIATAAFVTTTPGGGIVMVYAVIAPLTVLSVAGGDTVIRNGFGLPLWAAALIFIAAVSAAAAVLYAVSARRYRTANVKTANPALQYESK
ncbi:MAG: hypothetical protein NC401_12310, partial [Ruminococcus sp.]|nr:hypothetical protein [Ruminococcus sp.]